MTVRSSATAIDRIILPRFHDLTEGIKVRRVLPSDAGSMIGPFILFDQMGPLIFNAGEGFDMMPHPHTGITAVTYLIDGEITHRDNRGEVKTIRPGEVGWMTAGSGIVHSERTPMDLRASGNNLFGTQAWIALPARHEDIPASVSHYETLEIPRIYADGIEFVLIAGESHGLSSPVETYSEMIYAEIVLTSGARYQVKPEQVERAIYILAGEIEVIGQPGTFGQAELLVLKPGAEIVLHAPTFHAARFMLMGGEPMSEPRHIYWNFVSSSAERIEQAKNDWHQRRFPVVQGEEGFIPLPR